MNLRARLALFVAAAVAVAVAAVASAAYVSARREARGEIDAFLEQRASLIRAIPTSRFPDSRMTMARRIGGVELFRLDSVVQAVDTGGAVVAYFEGEPVLPVESVDQAVAVRGDHYAMRDVWVDDVHYRMITAPLAPQYAVQIARDVTETDAILGGLGLRLVGVGGLGVALAALMGWLVASRAVKPVEELTATAEHVASTQDLDAPIRVDRDDEVGRLAGSFNTMLRALGASRRQQQQLVADASHELRTPLTSLRTNIEVLARSADLDPDERRDLLADVTFELEELTDLVSELVELATDTRGAGEAVTEVDLVKMVEQVAERTRRRTGRDVIVDGRPGLVEGRPAMLERAIGNLVDNAHKWSPPGTPIEVRVADGRVTVRDHGSGIDPADQDHVFDRFYRAASARSLPGSGLGLAIVKQVVDAHGGRVWVEEAPGGGAVVGLEIPPTQPESAFSQTS